jgi:tetratricopeptide (TPR) repeat protein/transglutaminase-like putative cysteine protease
MHATKQLSRMLFATLLAIISIAKSSVAETNPWDGPAFQGNPAAIITAASSVDGGKGFDALILLDEHKFSIDEIGRAIERLHLVYRVDTADGVRNWGSTGIRWEPWRQKQPLIRARVITANGVEHMLDPKTLSDAPEREDTPEIFSDARIYRGPLPAVAVGSVVEVEIICEDTAPAIPGGMQQRVHLQRSVPVRQARLILQRPDTVPLKYEVRLLPDAKMTQKKSNNVIEDTIENGPLDAYERVESNLPNDVAARPQVEFSTAASWENVAAAYGQLAEPQIQPDSVRELVGATVSPGDSREEKIRKLTAKLHREIRYTGIEFGEAKLAPQPAAEVLKRKYGDCKDKSATLVAMLRAANVPAYMALLDASISQDISPSLPGGNLFNHAIVYAPGKPALWIDATDEFSAPGNLPIVDQGRKALVIRPDTKELISTPIDGPEDNLVIETREFYLAEFGPARVVEKSEARGEMDRFFRSYYGTNKDSKKIQTEIENYVNRVYLSEHIEKLEYGDGKDLTKPFVLKIEAAKAKRGYTSLQDAHMAIMLHDLIDNMPDYFSMSDEELQKEKDKATKPQPVRVFDYVLPYAFVTEWRYRIVPPIGFKVRALPENRVQDMGPAKLTQNYSEDKDGVVQATFSFASGKSRYSVAEAEAVRKGISELLKTNAIIISFDQVGYALLSAGKTKEAITAFESIVKKHPNEALHRVQIARGLLEVGLAEAARSEAREAIRLEPGSALAHETLGWILQHDLIGRRFEKGFDLEGAKAEYRKALEIDPDDIDIRTEYAILLQYDERGESFGKKADLKGAVEQYRDLKKRKSDWAHLDDNLLHALFFNGQYKEVEELTSKLASDTIRISLAIAARAAAEGSEAALKKSLELTPDEESRMKALSAAASRLLAIRMYKPAAELLGKINTGKSSLELIQAIANTQRYESLTVSEKDAAEYVRKMLVLVMGPDSADRSALAMFVKAPQPKKKAGKQKQDEEYESLRDLGLRLRHLAARDLPFETRGDVFLSNMHLEAEGDEASGCRVQVRGLGIDNIPFFVIKDHEQGQYRILNYNKGLEPIGRVVLSQLQKNDLAGARRWLDWAREERSITGGDDPFAGPIFPRLWRKGQNGDKQTMQRIAAAMLASSQEVEPLLPLLVAARKQARDESERSAWTLALGSAYSTLEKWSAVRIAAEQLLHASNDSVTAFQLYAVSCIRLKDWNAAISAANERKARFPRDPDAVAILSTIADQQGKLDESLNILRSAIKESSKPSAALLNNYSWNCLFMDKMPEDAIEMAQRAVRVTEGKKFGVIHTLSAVYAEVGRVGEARELLLKGMEDENMDEPDSSIWYVFGRIAEQYGRIDAAVKAYQRVEKEQEEGVGSNSTYNLAQRRIALISGGNTQIPASTIRHAPMAHLMTVEATNFCHELSQIKFVLIRAHNSWPIFGAEVLAPI